MPRWWRPGGDEAWYNAAMPFTDVRAVLFDLDGTLVHTHIDFPQMKRQVLAVIERHGLDPARFCDVDSLSAIEGAARQVAAPERFLEEAEATLVEIEMQACERAEPAHGAAETLAWLRERDVRVGIVTRNCRRAVQQILRDLHLPHEVLLTRADTPRVKPDPVHLTLALERLGARPTDSVMVGDHQMDVRGGKAAAMLTVGVLTAERPDDYFAGVAPDAVIRALPELRDWISPSSS
jgi:phosphoglycolate phosphatase